MVAVPAVVGVKTPEEVIEPPVADQLTALLNASVPVTVAVQVEVWLVRMEEGEQLTETEEIVETVTVAEPDFVES
jgi:hypothetical protein